MMRKNFEMMGLRNRLISVSTPDGVTSRIRLDLFRLKVYGFSSPFLYLLMSDEEDIRSVS